jgi:hypothetical protein
METNFSQQAPQQPFLSRQIYTVEVAITNYTQGSGENYFKDVASGTLLNPGNTTDRVVIRAIETYSNDVYGVAPSGNLVVSTVQAANLVYTFRVGEDEPIYGVPIMKFSTQLNFGVVCELFPTPINLLKSSVSAMGTIPAGLSVMVGFHYERMTAAEYAAFAKKYPYPTGGLQNSGTRQR